MFPRRPSIINPDNILASPLSDETLINAAPAAKVALFHPRPPTTQQRDDEFGAKLQLLLDGFFFFFFSVSQFKCIHF